MVAARLELALERMGPGDWLEFEKFAAEFLAVEYPSLRTTASPHGDRGRDGQLYVVDEEPKVAVQYSVTANWRAKVRETVNRIAETLPQTRRLIYATNQSIGPDADDLVQELRIKQGISLDIRDRSWFIARELTNEQRAVVSEELAKRFVDPLLEERGLREHVAPALNGEEARVALLHLALEREDRASNKGLTRSSFETLVLSALHDTSSEKRISRDEIIERVRRLLPAGHGQQIGEQANSALTRLSRRGGPVTRYRQTDEYHLSFPEQEKLHARLAKFLLEEHELVEELITAVHLVVPSLDMSDEVRQQVAADLRFGLETVLLRRGEAFAAATESGVAEQVTAADVLAVITEAGRSTGALLTNEQAAAIVLSILDRPSPAVRSHLRRMADAYTMYAFLRQTPDVQRVVLSMFSGGDLWLDTTAILPLVAETLLDDPADRHYTTILRAAREAGLKLYVTDGVIEEVERHLNRCLIFARTQTSDWRSSVPFVYSAYAFSGRSRREFASWLENFRGSRRPLDDLREYLEERYDIDRRNLTEYAERASTELRGAVQEIWLAVHERRRMRDDPDMDILTMHRLAEHDVENTVGIIELRRQAASTPMGYRQWFLTLDNTALRLKRELRERLVGNIPDSPAMSPDFMAEYLRLAPVRTAIEHELWINLPLLTDISRFEFLPKTVIDLADQLREENRHLDDRVARRRVRDRLDEEQVRIGAESMLGVRGSEERMLSAIQRQITGGRDQTG